MMSWPKCGAARKLPGVQPSVSSGLQTKLTVGIVASLSLASSKLLLDSTLNSHIF